MPIARKYMIGAALACLAGSTVMLTPYAASTPVPVEAPALVQILPGKLQYWAPGEFTHDGKPVTAPSVVAQIRWPLDIMTHQVTDAEYNRCVEERACPARDGDSTAADMPAVMVSWRDAQFYASWLTRKLGVRYRLPTDEEWTYAAGSRAPDETPLAIDINDPSKAWLARYRRESRLQPVNSTPMPIGYFGVNENGLRDMAGNVWEWTDTCFTRSSIDGGTPRLLMENCGVRVVEGPHRTYVSDFIRDARAGGCAVGIPPSNLGFRLVRETGTRAWQFSFHAIIGKILSVAGN